MAAAARNGSAEELLRAGAVSSLVAVASSTGTTTEAVVAAVVRKAQRVGRASERCRAALSCCIARFGSWGGGLGWFSGRGH